jgi:hypothetical protein
MQATIKNTLHHTHVQAAMPASNTALACKKRRWSVSSALKFRLSLSSVAISCQCPGGRLLAGPSAQNSATILSLSSSRLEMLRISPCCCANSGSFAAGGGSRSCHNEDISSLNGMTRAMYGASQGRSLELPPGVGTSSC